MVNANSLTIMQLNGSHAYFDLHQELFWLGGQAVYRPAGGYARIATLIKQIRAARYALNFAAPLSRFSLFR